MRKFKKYGLVFTFVFFAIELYPQLEAKANVLTSLGLIPNVGIEIQTGEKNTLQLDVLASFWNKINNSKTPLHINQTFLEYRFYKKNDLSGLFIGPHIGYGMFTLKKPNFAIIYDPYGSSNYDNDTYQSGRVAFYGLTIGYKKDSVREYLWKLLLEVDIQWQTTKLTLKTLDLIFEIIGEPLTEVGVCGLQGRSNDKL